MQPLEESLAKKNMGIVTIQQGPHTQPLIFPLVDGKPIPPEQLKGLVDQGQVPESHLQDFEKELPAFQTQLEQVGRSVGEFYHDGMREIVKMKGAASRELVEKVTNPIKEQFKGGGVIEFVDELVEDVVELYSSSRDVNEEDVDLSELYDVNIVLEHSDQNRRPVVIESTPSMINLLGTVEPKIGPRNLATSDYSGIRGGAILNANHGYLIIDVNDLLSEPGAWRALMRTLRTGMLEIVPPELGWMQSHVVIQPEPIQIRVRVILIGDAGIYYRLDQADPDFRELFKVLADFDNQLQRDSLGVQQYAAVVSRLTRKGIATSISSKRGCSIGRTWRSNRFAQRQIDCPFWTHRRYCS